MGKGKRNRGRRTALDDQIDAANAEMRRNLESALGIDRNAMRGKSPEWANEILDSVISAPRCDHLRRIPVQPSFLCWWEKIWRCRECTVSTTKDRYSLLEQGIYTGPGDAEEGTCDWCRKFVGVENLKDPFFIRSDIWMIVFLTCEPCSNYLQNQMGAQRANWEGHDPK